MTDKETAGADPAPVREDLVADAVALAFEDGDTKPAEKPAEAPQATEATEPAAPPAGDEPQDPWADAPEHLRTAYETQAKELTKLKETWERQRNQTAGLSRKIEELQRQLQAKAPEPPQEEQEPDELDEELTRLRDEFPDISKPVDALAARYRAQEARLAEMQAAHEAARSRETATEASKVEEKHAGWFELITKDKAADWAAFVNDPDQPYWVHQAAVVNGEEIVDAASAIRLLDAFKKHLSPSDPPPEKDPQTAELRRRQLAGAASPPPRGVGAVTSGAPVSGDRATMAAWAAKEVFEKGN
jgi:hypothetical protein